MYTTAFFLIYLFIEQARLEASLQKNNVRKWINTIGEKKIILTKYIVKVRINGTKNIAKITKSMKMVSAAKLRGDQQRLAAANPFAVKNY